MSHVSQERWAQVKSLFIEISEAPPEERARLLDEHCAGDEALRRELVDLLAAGDDAIQSGDVLDQSLAGIASELLEDVRAAGGDSPGVPAWGAPEGAGQQPEVGTFLDGFLLHSVLGEGGMGLVFEAEQVHPRRRVALKVVRGGAFVHERARQQFQREVDALARLQHSGIAAIHASGRTGEGTHYLVMELVRGTTLDQWLAARAPVREKTRSEVGARLALFLELCDAISYAHQRGVIHRDLKPSNVMVVEGVQDAGGSSQARIKVLDFGLARITEPSEPEAQATSRTRTVRGTVRYMSPEQATSRDVDVRSDVYSLGLILYEMLADVPAFVESDLPVHEALRAVAEAPLRRPSAVAPWLRGDLETILLRALEKSPDDRYQSVSALADDIRRHLQNFPIVARPPSFLYQLQKHAIRHRLAVGIAITLVAVLALGAVGTTVGLVRARQAEAEARAKAEEARIEAEASERVAAFLESIFAVSDPTEARGNAITARELLDRGAESIETELSDQPDVKWRLLGVIGRVYLKLGLYAEARPRLEQSLVLRREVLGNDHLDVATAEYELAGLLRRLGAYDDALPLYERALATRTARLGDDHRDVAASSVGLANLHLTRGEHEKARELYERAIAVMERAVGPDHPDITIYLFNHALLLTRTGDYAGARTVLERSIAIEEREKGRDHPDLAYDLTVLGFTLNAVGDHDGALAAQQRALEIHEATLGPEHPDVAETLTNIGSTLARAGRTAAAIDHHERALAIARKAFGPGHVRTAEIKDGLSSALREAGRIRRGRQLAEEALPVIQAHYGKAHMAYTATSVNLALYQVRDGAFDAARSRLTEAIDTRERILGDSHEYTVELWWWLARVERDAGDRDAARRCFAHAAAAVEQWGTVPARWGAFFEEYAALLEAEGDMDEASAAGARARAIGGAGP